MRLAHSTRSLPDGESSAAGALERKRQSASSAPIHEYQVPTLLQPPCSNRSSRVRTHFDDRPVRSLAGFNSRVLAGVSGGDDPAGDDPVNRGDDRFLFLRKVFI